MVSQAKEVEHSCSYLIDVTYTIASRPCQANDGPSGGIYVIVYQYIFSPSTLCARHVCRLVLHGSSLQHEGRLWEHTSQISGTRGYDIGQDYTDMLSQISIGL
jgi:hypothetical protein